MTHVSFTLYWIFFLASSLFSSMADFRPSSLAISVIVYVLLTCIRMAFFFSAARRAARSSFNFVRSSIPKSGLFRISSITLSVA